MYVDNNKFSKFLILLRKLQYCTFFLSPKMHYIMTGFCIINKIICPLSHFFLRNYVNTEFFLDLNGLITLLKYNAFRIAPI